MKQKKIIKFIPCWHVLIIENAKNYFSMSTLAINILAKDINEASSIAYKYAFSKKLKKPDIHSIVNTGCTLIELET